jgi:hypothetical protein
MMVCRHRVMSATGAIAQRDHLDALQARGPKVELRA